MTFFYFAVIWGGQIIIVKDRRQMSISQRANPLLLKNDELMKSLRLKYSSNQPRQEPLSTREVVSKRLDFNHCLAARDKDRKSTTRSSSSLHKMGIDTSKYRSDLNRYANSHLASDSYATLHPQNSVRGTVLGLKRMNSLLQELEPGSFNNCPKYSSLKTHSPPPAKQQDYTAQILQLDSPIKLIYDSQKQNYPFPRQPTLRNKMNSDKQKRTFREGIDNTISRVDSILDNIRRALYK